MFGLAKCGHCGNSGTKITEIEPNGARYKQSAIVCMHCSAILGVTGYYDTGSLVKGLEAKIAQLEQRAQQIDANLNNLIYQMQR